ncbi:MAG: peptide MFS transporter [Bacteroidia bacterium]
MDLGLGLLIFGWIFVIIWVPVVILSQRKIHPKALFVLFFAELWERFSFYGMRSLLMLYMVMELFSEMDKGEADTKAYGIYGSYMALVYATPVLGGIIADKILGFRRSIILGGVFMALGHFVLGFEGQHLLFYLALGLIIVGNGFFKPNISSFLGTFYKQNDPRKDGAFTIFYMGVNIGAFLAPLTCGYIGMEVSWFWGFSLAGFGMLVGLVMFWFNMKGLTIDEDMSDEDSSGYESQPSMGEILDQDLARKQQPSISREKGLPPNPEELHKPVFLGMSRNILIILGAVVSVFIAAAVLNENDIMKWVMIGIAVLIIGYLLFYSINTDNKVEGQRLQVVIVLFFFHMMFWALFEQAGGSLTLFAERNVDRSIFGSEPIPTPIFQSLNPLFIMLLAPVFSWIWIQLSRRKKEPTTPMKFVLGLVQLCLGFVVLVAGAKLFAGNGFVPLIFLVLMYMLHTMGELSLSPVGLSMVSKLSPPRIVGFVMGAWFLSMALAHEVAAELGKLTSVPDAETANVFETLNAFSDMYAVWGIFGIGGASLLLFLLTKPLSRMMHGIH